MDSDIAVVGAGVVGAATALELARRGASVALLEAQEEPALGASGTNSGILHTGFDSIPGVLETKLILRAAELRDPVLDALAVPVLCCGALMRPLAAGDRRAIERLAQNARVNGVEATLAGDGSLAVPGEAATDPVAFTLALVAAAERHGATLRTGFRVEAIERRRGDLALSEPGGGAVAARLVVNCAGLGAARVARSAGDGSFDVYPRKGEFLVFDPPPEAPLRRILLPVPSESTKGVLVFPTVDGKVVAGPTAVDQEDPDDLAVRPGARAEILPKAAAMYPPLADLEPIFSYAGLRPAGRGVNYVIGASPACPELVNVAAIRSTGLTAAPAIAERVAAIVADRGIAIGQRAPLERGEPVVAAGPWWRRAAERRRLVVGEDLGL
ncbi:MAG TPA: FAD-dependent oxidoreductase [Thermoleophilaceae bacterium]|nr:FAD-dependent oxidoreductase [Thermoleophilaceae bacterium]